MNYLFYGTEQYLIDLEIKKIIDKTKINQINIIKYDLDNDLFDNMLEECTTVSLFGDNKLIIVSNLFNKLEKDNEEKLLNYINNSSDNILIIVSDKLDERKKIVKEMKKICTCKEFNHCDINTLTKKMFDDYKIDNQCIDLLIKRVGNNLNNLTNEINKIKLYKDQDKTITKDDIINLTHKNIDLDVFKLIDYIIKKDKNKAVELYHELIKNGTEVLGIIIMLANQFRIMYQAKELILKGYTEKDIANTINIHPYRVKLALQNSRNYSSTVLLNYLEKLADLDIKIKSGQIDKNLGLELFILNI